MVWYKNSNTKIPKTGSHHITWNIDKKTTSDNFIIANHFNSFFTSIAGKLLKKIPKAKKSFSFFLTKKIQKHSFYLPPQLRKLKM